jgi:uncharacterized protein DUF4124
MSPIARLALVAVASLACSAATAQTVKCIDKNGRVTYTNVKCSELGLKEGGEVPDRLNTSPAYEPTEQAETRQRSSPPPAPPAEVPKPAAAPAAAPKGDADQLDKRRCFKTAQGYRCNEGDNAPEEKK